MSRAELCTAHEDDNRINIYTALKEHSKLLVITFRLYHSNRELDNILAGRYCNFILITELGFRLIATVGSLNEFGQQSSGW